MTDNLPATRQTIPTAAGTPLEGSPHLYVVHSLLCSGWHPIKVAIYLAERGTPVPVEAIDAYYQSIPDEDMLPGTAITRFFRGLDVISDPVRTMHEMLMLRKTSLAKKIEAAGDGEWPASVDVAAKDVFDMAAELKGLLDGPTGSGKVPDTMVTRTTPTLRDMLMGGGKKKVTAERLTIEDVDGTTVEGEFNEVNE